MGQTVANDPIKGALDALTAFDTRFRPKPRATKPIDWLGQNELERQALAAQPDPNAEALANAQSAIVYNQARKIAAERLGGPPQQTPFNLPPSISRRIVPFPDRPALPQSNEADIATAIMSVLFPQAAAGMYGARTRAAVDEQGRRQAEGLQRFQYDTQQAGQEYEDANAVRAEQIRNALLNRDTDFANRTAEYNQRREDSLIDPEIARNQSLIAALTGDSSARRSGAQANLRAQQGAADIAREAKKAEQDVEAERDYNKALMQQFPDLLRAMPKPPSPVDQAREALLKAQTEARIQNTILGRELSKAEIARRNAATAKLKREAAHVGAISPDVVQRIAESQWRIRKMQSEMKIASEKWAAERGGANAPPMNAALMAIRMAPYKAELDRASRAQEFIWRQYTDAMKDDPASDATNWLRVALKRTSDTYHDALNMYKRTLTANGLPVVEETAPPPPQPTPPPVRTAPRRTPSAAPGTRRRGVSAELERMSTEELMRALVQ